MFLSWIRTEKHVRIEVIQAENKIRLVFIVCYRFCAAYLLLYT